MTAAVDHGGNDAEDIVAILLELGRTHPLDAGEVVERVGQGSGDGSKSLVVEHHVGRFAIAKSLAHAAQLVEYGRHLAVVRVAVGEDGEPSPLASRRRDLRPDNEPAGGLTLACDGAVGIDRLDRPVPAAVDHHDAGADSNSLAVDERIVADAASRR